MTPSPTSNPAGSPKVTPVDPPANGGSKPREFERFEGLARKLAKVPKSEVDAKRKG